ncbi:hypothetical protein JST99_04155 [Candidatus Dependentiae bacterium]|nr:hypothetical protein [Candidatus Dependentiae bacterium]MCC7415386.1 hypothetical protein [Campylobacterota bacterium]
MSRQKLYSFLLITLFGSSALSSSSVQAYDRYDNNGVYFASFLIGLTHGCLKKTSEYIDFKAQATRDFKKDKTFDFITFISAHMIRLQLLNNKNAVDLDTKNMVSAWWHGFGQALVASYDVRTGTIGATPMNLTLIVAALGCGALTLPEIVKLYKS